MSITCSKCGMQLPAGSKFCAGCGNRLSDAAPAPAPAAAAPEPRPPEDDGGVPVAEGEKYLCPVCGKMPSGNMAKALGRMWHVECFKCQDCGQPISGPFNAEGGKPYCQECFKKKLSGSAQATPSASAGGAPSSDPNVCPGCGKAASGKVLKVLGHLWHLECFKCQNCHKDITGAYHDQGGMPYCPECYQEKFAAHCAKCGKPISGPAIVTKDQSYHKECFVCSKCGQALTKGCGMKNGELFCATCLKA